MRALAVTLLAAAVAVSTANAGGSGTRLTVTSTLDGQTVLPLRIRWIAHPTIPSSRIARVDYLIDGQLAWIERKAPYYYGGNEGKHGNWLVTSFLKPGLHAFTVDVLTTRGATTSDTVKARVIAAPPPPSDLIGAWTRVVTKADLKKAPPPGPPAGRWTITISSVGWATGPGDDFDVRYLPDGNVVMGPEVVTPDKQAGGFCGVDPLFTWTVAVAADDQSMQLNPTGADPCGGRVAVLQGTWTRAH